MPGFGHWSLGFLSSLGIGHSSLLPASGAIDQLSRRSAGEVEPAARSDRHSGPLQRIPEIRIDQRFFASEIRVFRRIDVFVLARFGVSVVEDDDSALKMAVMIDALIAARAARTLVHGRRGPPEA